MHEIYAFLAQNAWLIGLIGSLVAIFLYVYRPGARSRYEEDAHIPFDEDASHAPHNRHSRSK